MRRSVTVHAARSVLALAVTLLVVGVIALPAAGRSEGNDVKTVEPGVLTLSNPGPITIPFGAAIPYPSSISARWCSGAISDVNVSLHGFGHSSPNDVDIVLRGPTGQSAMLMSDVGASGGVEDIDLFLDDEAGTALPNATTMTAGTFQPTDADAAPGDFGTDAMPTPAPSPTTSALSVFDGTTPAGEWDLFVADDFSGVDNGDLEGGWRLRLEVTPQTCPVTVQGGKVKEGSKRTFIVIRTGPVDGSLTVAYATKRGSASGKDFRSISGDLTFASGDATTNVIVKTRSDRLDAEGTVLPRRDCRRSDVPGTCHDQGQRLAKSELGNVRTAPVA